MKRNLSELERILRVVLGVYAMLLGYLFIQGVVGGIVGTLGFVSFLTGLVGWCGVYALLGKAPLEFAPAESTVIDEDEDL